MYCGSCGSEVGNGQNFCQHCGAQIASSALYTGAYAGTQGYAPSLTVNQELANLQILFDQGVITEQEFYTRRGYVLSQPGVAVPMASAPVQDAGSIGWWFLGFFFPIVGLILFLVWKDEKPLSAKRAGWGALVSVIVFVVLIVVYFLFLFWLMASFY